MNNEGRLMLSILILGGSALISPIVYTVAKSEKDIKKYNELPLTAGTVVEKVKVNDNVPQTMLLVDTDDNKDTIERVIFVKDSPENNLIIDKINKNMQIKFKDAYENETNKLSERDIYQIDDLILKQR